MKTRILWALAGLNVLLVMTLAGRLTSTVRAQDRVVRIGGEEFVVVLPGAEVATAREVAARLLETVRAEPFQLRPGAHAALTASIGLATGPASDALLQAADRALYLAKGQGRDRTEEALHAPRAATLRGGEVR